MIRSANEEDSKVIAEIYNHYIENSIITFEEKPVTPQDIKTRIHTALQENLSWLVYEMENVVLGYAYASKWKSRCSYRYTVESSVYVSKNEIGKGIGKKLYEELLRILKEKKYHSIIAGISLPNEKSQRLHEKFGFNKVAHFTEVGFKFNNWIDVGYWELIL